MAARQVALAALTAVFAAQTPLDQFLDGDDAFKALEPRDRAFVRMLVATAFRRLGEIDDFIRRATEKAEPPTPLRLYNLLRLGVAQIAFMDAPDYAVVNTAVEMAAALGLERQKGLVNAVLRRTAREWRGWAAQQDAARLNIPAWLWEAWVADYGDDVARRIAEASLTEAPLDLTLRDPAQAGHYAALLDAVPLPTGSLRRQTGNVTELPGFAEGAWWVQDAAAALPARLFGDVAGRLVVDLCAAPGGKAAQLAAQGARVVALDRSAARTKRLAENLARLKFGSIGETGAVEIVIADAATHTLPPTGFILLDAPCTATGTIRRHPDLLYLKTAEDVTRLAALQARLLDRAVAGLAPGGVLLYCTCSLQKAEGEAQVAALLARDATVTRVPVAAAEIGGLDEAITAQGDARLLPYHLAAHGGLDGFYIARLVRRGRGTAPASDRPPA